MDWPNHAFQLVESVGQLRQNGGLTDVILSAEGKLFRAHKVILAASSKYFHVSYAYPFFAIFLKIYPAPDDL